MSFILSASRTHYPLLLLQSSAAQSSLSILRRIIAESKCCILLCCLLHSPSTLVNLATSQCELKVLEHVQNVPGYDDVRSDLRESLLSAVRSQTDGLNVVLDSVDTLCSDIGSVSQTYNFIRELFAIVRNRAKPSSLILHITSPSPLIPLLSSCTLSSPLVHLIAHPPALITHLATSYLTLPPPASPPAKFWAIFIPLSERGYESDRLVFGPGGEGCGDAGTGEFAVEILLRGGDDGVGVRRKGVERVLEGWSGNGPCGLAELQILKGIWSRKSVDEAVPDPTQNVPFNLNLTPSQRESRAQVPLPYAHEGKPLEKPAKAAGVILYEPDSADDIDDDDPDEDLDI